MLQDTLQQHMVKTGIHVHTNSNVEKVTSDVKDFDLHKPFPKTVHTKEGEKIETDVLLWAIGRHSLTDNIGAEKIGLELRKNGDIPVDEYQNTNVDNVFAIGDVAGKALLTPVAIAAGRRLSNRLYGGVEGDKLSYDDIPTVVFSYVLRAVSPPTCADSSAAVTRPSVLLAWCVLFKSVLFVVLLTRFSRRPSPRRARSTATRTSRCTSRPSPPSTTR